MVKFLDPDADPDYHQNLVNWSLDYVKPFHKISQRFDQYFLSNRVNRQTDICDNSLLGGRKNCQHTSKIAGFTY